MTGSARFSYCLVDSIDIFETEQTVTKILCLVAKLLVVLIELNDGVKQGTKDVTACWCGAEILTGSLAMDIIQN